MLSSRCELGTFLGELILVCVLATGSAVADTISEIEPNDTIATANLTYGSNSLGIVGSLSPATDQDCFSFVVTKLGVPDPSFSTSVRIFVTTIPNDYQFSLIDPSGTSIFSTKVSGPRIFDFNANAIGGLGKYTIQLAATSPSSVGSYQISIFSVADGAGQPPVIVGSGSIGGQGVANGIPAVSKLNLLLLTVTILCMSVAFLRTT